MSSFRGDCAARPCPPQRPAPRVAGPFPPGPSPLLVWEVLGREALSLALHVSPSRSLPRHVDSGSHALSSAHRCLSRGAQDGGGADRQGSVSYSLLPRARCGPSTEQRVLAICWSWTAAPCQRLARCEQMGRAVLALGVPWGPLGVLSHVILISTCREWGPMYT